MLRCELCPKEATTAILPLVGDVDPGDVVLVHVVGYTCTDCAAGLIENERGREMPLEDHNAEYDPETGRVRNATGWVHSNKVVYAGSRR